MGKITQLGPGEVAVLLVLPLILTRGAGGWGYHTADAAEVASRLKVGITYMSAALAEECKRITHSAHVTPGKTLDCSFDPDTRTLRVGASDTVVPK